MPIVIPSSIPAFKVLSEENIFVMSDKRAASQDIRPLEIAIVNLMPTKIETETQLMRLLGNSPLQVHVTLIKTETYKPSNIAPDHMERYYLNFSDIKDRRFDGMIVTGAPVETIDFSEVKYWEELKEILAYADTNVTSAIFVCWGAQAAMQYYYGIGKLPLKSKKFGVFRNAKCKQFEPLLKGTDDCFYIPHSRHTKVDELAVRAHPALEILAAGKECGISIVKSKNGSKIFLFGHSEYDRETLAKEYYRDLNKGLPVGKPVNYFTGEPPKSLEELCARGADAVNFCWSGTANLMYYNWLNHYVYQVTPYKI